MTPWCLVWDCHTAGHLAVSQCEPVEMIFGFEFSFEDQAKAAVRIQSEENEEKEDEEEDRCIPR